MGIDTLEVAQHVEMQRTGLEAVGPAVAKAFQMTARRLLLQPADMHLHFHQLTREGFIPGRFICPHGACFDHDGNIFVVEWVEVGRVTKLRKV